MPFYRDDLDRYMTEGPGGIWRRLPARNLIPSALALDMPNEFIREDPDRYGANGYATLTIDGRR
jgi:hypothetical protein